MAKDRKIDMVILGLLSHENLTGYDIKKRIDNGISFFWKGSFGSIYPALAAMEADGLVAKEQPLQKENSDETPAQSGREKIYYSITEAGKKSLVAWLEDSKVTNDLKYETLLKLFFGGAVDESVTLKTIDDFEKDVRTSLEILKLYKARLSKVLNEREHVYYYLTVSFGVETYEAYLKWCAEARKILSRNK